MKNVRYQILRNYFNKKVESTSGTLKQSDEFFQYVDKLADDKKLSMEECDSIIGQMIDYAEYAIEVIANCPFVEIKVNLFNDRIDHIC